MRLLNYELGESFLTVGPSTFFRAQNVVLGNPVVVRRLTIDPARADDARATFFREARHAAALWHPRIWRPLDVLEAEGFLWSVHENRTATTLEQVVTATGPLPLARVARLGVQVADALAHVHARGWVHGKVTPRTVTLDEGGDAQLINFVKSADLAAGLWPLRPIVLGLSAFSAPEELHGARPGPPADLYGLAATLLFCLTGRLPRGGDEQQALARARAGDPVDTSALRVGVPQALAGALEGALEADPEARHGSVAALGSLLAELERRHVADVPAGFEAGTLLPPLCEEGDVRIVERHGAGAFGIVFRAELSGGGCQVAVKALKPEHRDDREALERFLREARAIEGVEHENVVRIYGVGEQRGTPYVVMEFIPGPDLATVLLREGRLEPARAARLMAGVARGLAAIHREGVIHRDLKPHNVLIDRAPVDRAPVDRALGAGAPDAGAAVERPVIADFGVARTTAGARLTMTGQLVGSPAYMAPEQVTDQAVTAAVDLYALGVMLYELLTGHTPFSGSDALTTLRRIRDEAHAPLPAEVPEDLRRIVDQLLAKAPGQRFADANLLAAALDQAAAEPGAPVASIF